MYKLYVTKTTPFGTAITSDVISFGDKEEANLAYERLKGAQYVSVTKLY